ncbi:MAG: hypothetical protein JJT76_17440 [Clostridiaceae bacterium]|nr:hypothetical protein [Clostridiaceae bacterium]
MIFRKSVDIKVDEKIIKKNRVPLLIKDKQWKTIIGSTKNKMVDSLSKELNELVDEEKQLQKKLGTFKSDKEKLINRVLHLSDLINSQGQENAMAELENCKNQITIVNDNIDDTLEALEIYPSKIEEINLRLLKETIKIAYRDITTDNDELLLVDKKIQKLRGQLGQLRDEKSQLESRIGMLYSFLHMMLGPEEMEKLDIRFLDK